MNQELVTAFHHVEILEKIGEGSYGSVYKAHHKGTGEVVAIKTIAFDETQDNLESIKREINILRQCKNINIVSYKGSFIQDQLLYIAMEYCEVGSCSEVIQLIRRPFNDQQICFVVREALKGLQYLHSIKKLHRDIKGGNILILADGQVKLADFGVSTQLQNTVSKANTFIGTPYWMAPEVILGKPYNDKADVWSLGITAIELADMVPPFSDLHPMKVLFFIPNGPLAKPRNAKNLSPALLNLISIILVKDPSKRPQAATLLNDAVFTKTNRRSLFELVEEVLEKKLMIDNDTSEEDEFDAECDSQTIFRSGTVVSGSSFDAGTVVSTRTVRDGDNNTGTMIVHTDSDEDYDSNTCVVNDNILEANSEPPGNFKLRGMFDTVDTVEGSDDDQTTQSSPPLPRGSCEEALDRLDYDQGTVIMKSSYLPAVHASVKEKDSPVNVNEYYTLDTDTILVGQTYIPSHIEVHNNPENHGLAFNTIRDDQNSGSSLDSSWQQEEENEEFDMNTLLVHQSDGPKATPPILAMKNECTQQSETDNSKAVNTEAPSNATMEDVLDFSTIVRFTQLPVDHLVCVSSHSSFGTIQPRVCAIDSTSLTSNQTLPLPSHEHQELDQNPSNSGTVDAKFASISLQNTTQPTNPIPISTNTLKEDSILTAISLQSSSPPPGPIASTDTKSGISVSSNITNVANVSVNSKQANATPPTTPPSSSVMNQKGTAKAVEETSAHIQKRSLYQRLRFPISRSMSIRLQRKNTEEVNVKDASTDKTLEKEAPRSGIYRRSALFRGKERK